MPEEKKCTKTEECCEGKEELSLKELEQVNDGMFTGATVQFKGEDIAKLNTTGATEALQGKAVGVVISSAGQPGAGASFRVRG